MEEIEREIYRDPDAWAVTVSFSKEPGEVSPLAWTSSLGRPDLNYKHVLVDAETGDFMAIKIREPATH